MQNVFDSLPGSLGARAAAIVAAREDGRNVHFINESGKASRFSFRNMERADNFRDRVKASGRPTFGTERDALAFEYKAKIGYDPFEDDPTISAEEVRQTLSEWDVLAGRED